MRGWTRKDERKYEHIKDGYLEQGKPENLAEEIAARTVNKERREEGRTPNKRTQGTGNPNLTLEQHTREELCNQAKERQIAGRSRMTKAELITALSQTQ